MPLAQPQLPHALRRRTAAPVRASWQRPALLLLAPVLGAAGLAGCASSPADPRLPNLVQPAENQPHARVLLRAKVPAGHHYLLTLLKDNSNCSGPQLVARSTGAEPPPPARLPVGALVTVDFAIVNPAAKHGCVSRWSFTPQAGKTYLVQGVSVGTACPARLLDATQADRPEQPADLVTRVIPGQNCLPLDQSPRVASLSPIQGGQVNGEAVLNPRATTRDLEGLIKP